MSRNTVRSTLTPSPVVFRQCRLSRGWEPTQLIGHMKIAARGDGVTLPATWLLLRLLFLWENQRAAVPRYYATLLHRVFTTPVPHQHPAVRS